MGTPLLRAIVGVVMMASTLTGIAASTPAGAQQPKDAAEQSATDDIEAAFVDRVNRLRRSHGLAPLRVDEELVDASRAWATVLAADGGIRHAGDLSVGVTEEWALLGENVGVTRRGVDVRGVEALMDAFVASPSHHANLVEPDFDAIGVGVAIGPDGRLYTTHRFMDSVATVERAPMEPNELIDHVTRVVQGSTAPITG